MEQQEGNVLGEERLHRTSQDSRCRESRQWERRVPSDYRAGRASLLFTGRRRPRRETLSIILSQRRRARLAATAAVDGAASGRGREGKRGGPSAPSRARTPLLSRSSAELGCCSRRRCCCTLESLRAWQRGEKLCSGSSDNSSLRSGGQPAGTPWFRLRSPGAEAAASSPPSLLHWAGLEGRAARRDLGSSRRAVRSQIEDPWTAPRARRPAFSARRVFPSVGVRGDPGSAREELRTRCPKEGDTPSSRRF